MTNMKISTDEICHTHRILAHGLTINPEGIALDVIENVGPGGHFLSQKHTRAHMREIWIPDLTHPRTSANSPQPTDIRQRAKNKLEWILAEHQPEPLEDDVQHELRSILGAAEREIKK
jgi:trimethylamine--corrinoid protein Co-methyltransferase